MSSNNAKQTSNCPVEYCPNDCEGQWGNWQTCSNLCNSNQEVSRIYNQQHQINMVDLDVIITMDMKKQVTVLL